MIEMSYIILLFYACQIYLAEFAFRVFKSFSVKYRLYQDIERNGAFCIHQKTWTFPQSPLSPSYQNGRGEKGEKTFSIEILDTGRADTDTEAEGGAFRKNERRKYIRGLPFFAPPLFGGQWPVRRSHKVSFSD